MIWWIKHLIICLVSGFVLIFGIQMFIVAWKLKNPYEFIMCLITSNVVILVSATLFFGFIYRMLRGRKDKEDNGEEKQDDV